MVPDMVDDEDTINQEDKRVGKCQRQLANSQFFVRFCVALHTVIVSEVVLQYQGRRTMYTFQTSLCTHSEYDVYLVQVLYQVLLLYSNTNHAHSLVLTGIPRLATNIIVRTCIDVVFCPSSTAP